MAVGSLAAPALMLLLLQRWPTLRRPMVAPLVARSPMFKWIQRALTPKNRFVIPAPSYRLPECCMRPFRAADFEQCSVIYRRNEGISFPEGCFENFAQSIQHERGPLYLVAEVNEVVTAYGGIFIDSESEQVGLTYGMVHPAF